MNAIPPTPTDLSHTVDPPKIGPVFICGRQHSGNSVMTTLLAKIPGCLAFNNEGIFFEHRDRLDRIKSTTQRARWIANNLKSSNQEFMRLAADWANTYPQDHPDTDALTLYRQMMQSLTDQTGKQFWCQKATSYIFYGHKILHNMPDARMIYLIRNPYDISTSRKRRAPPAGKDCGVGDQLEQRVADRTGTPTQASPTDAPCEI